MIRCFTVITRIPAIWAKVGKFIPYTRAQVIARRLARHKLMVVCVVVPGIIGGGIASLPPRPDAHPAHRVAFQPPLQSGDLLIPAPVLPPGPTWRATGEPVHVPEPWSAIMLASGVVMLWMVRRRG